MHTVPFKPADVLAAVAAGKARLMTAHDYMGFAGAPEGSMLLEWDADHLVVIGAGFQVEVHGVDADGDPFAFLAHADGHWVEA